MRRADAARSRGEGPELAQDEHVGCCFVAASHGGRLASTRSSVDGYLRRRHVPRQADRRAGFSFHVLGGRLYLRARVRRRRRRAREVVADDILCGGLSMRVNPRTDQPAILAIGLPDEDGDFDDASLYLFERQADRQWNREVVWQDQPIIDADFDFRPGGPQVAAATEHPDEALNADLHFLARFADRPGWDARPLTWNLAGF